MSEHNITIYSGSSLRLPTAGCYCDRDIIITGKNMGGDGTDVEKFLNGTIASINSSSLTSVRGYACRGCTTLNVVNIPNCTSIGTYSFYGCSGMTKIIAPKASSVSSYAFYGCSSLTEINFPLAKTVSASCFYNCTKLKKVDLGSASSIQGYGFAYCSGLEALILRKTDGVATLASNSFSGFTLKGYIYVPRALAGDYQTATNWSNYAGKIRAIEDYPNICG